MSSLRDAVPAVMPGMSGRGCRAPPACVAASRGRAATWRVATPEDAGRRLAAPSPRDRRRRPTAAVERRSQWTPPDVGAGRPGALRPGLPARLPPDRQPARRRGPDAGGLRPRLPVAVDVHARAPSRAGCTGSPPTSSSTRCAASSGSASTRCPRTPATGSPARDPGPERAWEHNNLDHDVQAALDHAAAGVPRRRRAVRHRGPLLRGDRRHARRQARHRALPHPPRPGRAAPGAGPPPARPAAGARAGESGRRPAPVAPGGEPAL